VALFALPLAWFAGGLAGLQAPAEIMLPALNTLSFLAVGVLVALDRRLPERLVTGLTVALGLLHGFLNGTAVGQGGGGALALVGISSTVFVLVALVAAIVVSLKKDWTRIVVRVAGSWIAAIGLLMLGWTISGRG
jgi:hydrogenase/urease accessory protein HupE